MLHKLSLPIDAHLETIKRTLKDYSTILVKASPGSGKTTRLPWSLVGETPNKVVVLEPRRLAAKLAAQRIASEESLTLGKEIGYQFRFENKTSSENKLIFYTEGTFLKKFLKDPSLSDIDIIILDEFHERHLDTDLVWALLRELQTKRPELKVIIMSATLDLKMLASSPDSKVIEIQGEVFPVDIHYLPNRPSILNQSLESKVKASLIQALNHEGDVLIFLPGIREMMRVQNVLNGDFDVYLLHADLDKEDQEQAILPGNRRKIILATNIAESSVTIPGIRIVIDSGLQREARYSPWNGLKTIQDAPVTKSSAIQRTGRAGRTAPGVCFRLYSIQDFSERKEHTIPEIEKADLTDTFLLVSGTGLIPRWYEAPHEEKWSKAKLLCERLGALSDSGEISPTGKAMLDFPLSARLSRILIEGQNLSKKNKESLLSFICKEIEGDRTGHLWRRLQFYLKDEGPDQRSWQECLLVGFIDQVARLRQKQHDFIHYSGKTIKIHHSLKDLHSEFYILLDITQRMEAIKVLEIHEEWLWDLIPFPISEEEEIQIDQKIQIKLKSKLGSIVLDETLQKVSWSDLSEKLKNKISDLSQKTMITHLEKFKCSDTYGRLHFWAKNKNTSLEKIEEKLTPKVFFEFEPSLKWETIEFFLKNYLIQHLEAHDIERELPSKINLGGKREIKVHYPFNMDPFLEAPIQDFYGLTETPRILNGNVPLTLKLLGPHKRPMQVTKDIQGFWHKTYQEMKKEYQRDYPRHYWPEKPWEAKPVLLKRLLPPT